MAIRDLVPFHRRQNRGDTAVSRYRHEDPFTRLRDEMERLFDTFLPDLLGGSEAPARAGAWGFSPGLDVEENDKEVIVSVDLPGVDEDDIDVRLEGDLLTVSGEKREEHEHSDRGWSHVERSYGRFQRSVALDTEVKAEEARASFRKGVLRITLPKSENQKRRGTAIPVKAG